RTEVEVGQPLTLTLRVSGSGAMGRLGIPHVAVEGFSIDALAGGSPDQVDAQGESVTRVFRYWVVPLARESQRLPEIELVYFNDVSGEYESSTTEAIALEIRESQLSVSTPSEEPAPAEVEVPGSDSDSKVNIRTLLLWLALALGVSLLIWLVALALLKRRKR
ncbi:MAG: BatD family protein, partial [Kofleriaceae bacterium]|nr:BatD family protein [Kofleriaceae bacterium]